MGMEELMSVTINWRPAAKNERYFTGGTSADLDALDATFGKRIDLGGLNTLRAMMRIASNKDFYAAIIEAVEKHECIEVWGSY